MEDEQLAHVLSVVHDALWAGVLLPECLPGVATALLADGADTSDLRRLAGLDLSPFDTRDARDLFLSLFAEISSEPWIPERSASDRIESAARALATAAVSGGLSTAATLGRFSVLAVAAEYPDHSEVMRLYGLNDEWLGGWGRTRPEIEAEVRVITDVLASRGEAIPRVIVDAIADSG